MHLFSMRFNCTDDRDRARKLSMSVVRSSLRERRPLLTSCMEHVMGRAPFHLLPDYEDIPEEVK